MDTLILSQPAKRKMCDIFKYSRLNVKKIILGKGKMILFFFISINLNENK